MADDVDRQLHEHARCVRSLATALLGDPSAGDDVAQQTLLAASTNAPRRTESLRAWMLRVARRFASRWRRGETRRARHARAATADDPPTSAADEAMRAEQLRAIAAAVAALTPPLRDVVLLRHYDELPPRAIAVRLSLSVEAVESRLRRAHEQLRVALRKHAPEGDLRRALLLLVGPGAWTTLPGAAVMTMKSKSSFAAAAILLLALGAALLHHGDSAASAAPEAALVAATPKPPAPPPASAATERVDAAPAAPRADPVDELPSWTAQLSGRVVDEWRLPIAGVGVVAEVRDGARAEGRSDAAGRFTLALPVSKRWSCAGNVRAAREQLADEVVFGASFESTHSDAAELVLLPTGRLVVKVREGRAAIAGASIAAIRGAWTPGMRHSATTGVDGDVTMHTLPPGRYVVGATAADGRWVAGIADAIGGCDVTLLLDLATTTPVPIAVRARDDRAPIGGARIEAMFEAQAESLAKVPLGLVVPLPSTDERGEAMLTGLCNGQRVGVGASHAAWRAMQMFNARQIDWRAAKPHAEVLLASMDTVVWQLVDGEVAVPPDGTEFRVLETRARLRDGRLPYNGDPQVDVQRTRPIVALGPGCYAELQMSKPVAGTKSQPAPVKRSRQLAVDLRDNAGHPLADWTLRISRDGERGPLVRTDSQGRAFASDLLAERVSVSIDERQWTGMREIGTVDLTRGDGTLTVALGPPRRVRANVWIDGRRGLPGRMSLRCIEGHITSIEEDVERGVLAFDVWTGTPGARLQLSIDPTQGLGFAHAVVESGTGPAEVDFRIGRNGSATVDLVLPADGGSQVQLERFHVQGNSGFWAFAATARGPAPPRLGNLPPGRYRLRDDLSEVIGPEVEVAANKPDARLTLDLSRVVSARGCVAASPPFEGTHVEVRERNGAVLRKKDVYSDGSFGVRAIVEPGTVLVAVRGDVRSAPVPWVGTMANLVLVLPH